MSDPPGPGRGHVKQQFASGRGVIGALDIAVGVPDEYQALARFEHFLPLAETDQRCVIGVREIGENTAGKVAGQFSMLRQRDGNPVMEHLEFGRGNHVSGHIASPALPRKVENPGGRHQA